MRKYLVFVLIFLLVLSSAVIPTSAQDTMLYQKGIVQTTPYGVLSGAEVEEGKSLAWLGVPYAKAPVDELRWCAPQEVEAWEGTREALTNDNFSIQMAGQDVVGTEDCLYLDIYRPNTDATNLPVMVFLHGGNNQTGNSKQMAGANLACATDAVIVSINYRLGALGWLNIPALKTGNPLEDSGNFGLLDAAQALKWVQKCIASFGGDPANITVSGSSAGGRDVLAMLISPVFDGLFAQAMPCSGGMTATDPALGQEVATRALAVWVVEDGKAADEAAAIEWLNTATPEVKEYLYAQPAERFGPVMANAAIRMASFPHLFADGAVLPKDGFDALTKGEYAKVPVLAVCDATEFTLFMFGDPYFAPKMRVDGKLTDDETVKAEYTFAKKYGSLLYTSSNADRYAAILADQEGQPPVYVMRSMLGENPDIVGEETAFLVGATHVSDLGFLMGNPKTHVAAMVTAEVPEDAMPGLMDFVRIYQGYVKNFLHTGDPNGDDLPRWEAWSNEAGGPKAMLLDADEEKAIVTMGTESVSDAEIFKLMREDATITQEQKDVLISTVLNGRFFSKGLDAEFGTK